MTKLNRVPFLHDYDPSIPITELENLKNFLVKIGADMSETENSVQRQKQVCLLKILATTARFARLRCSLRLHGDIVDFMCIMVPAPKKNLVLADLSRP